MISIEEIEKLSELSRVKFGAAEKKELQKDLEDILNYFNKLKSLDTSAINELGYSFGAFNHFREDEASDKLKECGDMLEQAPSKENGYFKVKKII